VDTCNASGTCIHAGNPCSGSTPVCGESTGCCSTNAGGSVACNIGQYITIDLPRLEPNEYNNWCTAPGCASPYYNVGSPRQSATCIQPADPGNCPGSPPGGDLCECPNAIWRVTCGPMVVDGRYSCNGVNCDPVLYNSDCSAQQ
jgi:hypothetical protein